jgi:beta-glucosidase
MVYETVSGIQSHGVITSTKVSIATEEALFGKLPPHPFHMLIFYQHFVAQEQETHRRPNREGGFQESVSSNVDDKTMHEMYLWQVNRRKY